MLDVVCCLVAKSLMTLVIPWTVACQSPLSMGFPRQEYWRHKRNRFSPWVGKIPWNRKWKSTLVFLPGKSCRQRKLAGYSPWGHKESDTTEHAQGSAPNLLLGFFYH